MNDEEVKPSEQELKAANAVLVDCDIVGVDDAEHNELERGVVADTATIIATHTRCDGHTAQWWKELWEKDGAASTATKQRLYAENLDYDAALTQEREQAKKLKDTIAAPVTALGCATDDGRLDRCRWMPEAFDHCQPSTGSPRPHSIFHDRLVQLQVGDVKQGLRDKSQAHHLKHYVML